MAETSARNEHERSTLLLPWYVNGTLQGTELESVESHIAACPSCRAEISHLGRLQNAIQKAGPVPLPPTPDPQALLARVGTGKNRSRHRGMYAQAGIAAGVLLTLATVAYIGMQNDLRTQQLPEYETATSPAAEVTMAYVFDIQFSAGTTDEARQNLLREVGATEQSELPGGNTVRVVIHSPLRSLQELESFSASLRDYSLIENVDIVAMQLPLRPEDQ